MTSPRELSIQLIDCLDHEHHVKDMSVIVDVLSHLERLPVTKEVLESTRLGKAVNEFRHKVRNEALRKRAKSLLKQWRDMVLEDILVRPHNGSGLGSGPHGGTGGHFSATDNNNGSTAKLAAGPFYNVSYSLSQASPCGSPQNSNSSSSFVNVIANNNNSSKLSPLLQRNIRNSAIGTLSSPSSSTLTSPSISSFKKSPYNFPLSSSTSPVLQSTSYAPNVEATSKTNSANKRYREDMEGGLNVHDSPQAKRARILHNGTGILDDPLDEISKDSVNSRTSDHSDSCSRFFGGSSSGFGSGFLNTAHELSNLSPPLAPSTSVDVPITVPAYSENMNSVSSDIANFVNNGFSALDDSTTKKKRKKKSVPNDRILDFDLREQIAMAEKAKRDRFAEQEPMDRVIVDNAELNRIQSAAKAPISVKSEIIENYLSSQAEMLRQAVNIPATELVEDMVDFKSEKKAKKSKHKQKKHPDKSIAAVVETSTDPESEKPKRMETEAEILSRLPPIDPSILADLEGFVYFNSPSSEETHHKEDDHETESALWREKPKVTKIDWGDSDDEDDNQEVSTTEVKPESVQPGQSYDPSSKAWVGTLASSNPEHQVSIDSVDSKRVEQLHSEKTDNLNGNTDKDGNFREWHETLTVDSYQSEPLLILPYTVIDF